MLVVPSKVGCKFPAKCFLALRHENPARSFILHRSDKAFNYGDATVLPDRAVSRMDRFLLHQRLNAVHQKMLSLSQIRYLGIA